MCLCFLVVVSLFVLLKRAVDYTFFDQGPPGIESVLSMDLVVGQGEYFPLGDKVRADFRSSSAAVWSSQFKKHHYFLFVIMSIQTTSQQHHSNALLYLLYSNCSHDAGTKSAVGVACADPAPRVALGWRVLFILLPQPPSHASGKQVFVFCQCTWLYCSFFHQCRHYTGRPRQLRQRLTITFTFTRSRACESK